MDGSRLRPRPRTVWSWGDDDQVSMITESKQVWKTQNITYFKHRSVCLECSLHSCEVFRCFQTTVFISCPAAPSFGDKTWTLFWKVYSERPLFTVYNFVAPQGPHVLRDLKKRTEEKLTYTAAAPSPRLPQKSCRTEDASAGKHSRPLHDAVQAMSANKAQNSGSESFGKMGRLFFRRRQPTAVTGGPSAAEFDHRDVPRGPRHLDCCARLHLSVEKETAESSAGCDCERWHFRFDLYHHCSLFSCGEVVG